MLRVDKVAAEYLEKKEENGIKKSTISTYSYIIYNQIIQFFHPNLEALEKQDLQFIIHYFEKYKSKNAVIVLKDFVTYMYENKYIDFIIKIQIPKTNHKKIYIFDHEEQKILIDYLAKNFNNFNFCVLLSLFVGLRIGEICGLQFKDISNNIIYITKTLQRIKNIDDTTSKTKIHIDAPKSRKSIREIPIPQFLIEKMSYLEKEDENSYLFTGKKNFFEPRTVERKFKKILEECNIEYRKFHILRHTFSTNAFEAKLDCKILSDILGHSTVKTTLDLYVHTNNKMKADFINQLCAF